MSAIHEVLAHGQLVIVSWALGVLQPMVGRLSGQPAVWVDGRPYCMTLFAGITCEESVQASTIYCVEVQ